MKKSKFWQIVEEETKKSNYKPFKRKQQNYKKRGTGEKVPFEQLSIQEQYRVLAERANKRLQRIEKYSQRDEYKELTKAAYNRAVYDIESLRGEGKKRFAREMPVDENEAKAALNSINKFLRSDTSTLKPGIGTSGSSVERYEAMAQKFNAKYTEGVEGSERLSWKEITTWYSSYNGKRVAKMFKSSDAVAIALGQFKKLVSENPKKKLKDWKKELEENPDLILSDDVLANKVMKEMINRGISPQNLFKQRK